MRGHGRSGKPADETAWESKRLADDFDAVVEGFKLVKPFVVGWYVLPLILRENTQPNSHHATFAGV